MQRKDTTHPPASTPTAPSAAVDVPESKELLKPEKDKNEVALNPFEHMSSQSKAGVLVLITVVSMAVGMTMLHVHTAPEWHLYGDLFTGQVMAFLWTYFFVFWWCGFQAVVLYDTLVGGEDRAAASRKYLSDDAASVLTSAAEFSSYLLFYYFCDRTSIVPREKKKYEPDTFWFLWVMLMICAFFTLRKAKPPADTPPAEQDTFHVKWLQREQTEEWKGWMQVMFLWYHYFEAKNIYNAIRLYIAAYVWMTGFGNFSYYYIRKDFSLERFCQMQWRLNFLVLWVCLMMGNEYMLYYINMLHTVFTMFIYIGLGVGSQFNTSTVGVTVKMAIMTAICAFIWDVPGVFGYVWAPLTFLAQYHDPANTKRPIMHEWEFRSFLDHFIWIVGMITAFNHPNVDAWMVRIDSYPRLQSFAAKLGVLGALCFAMYLYVVNVFNLPKKEYNALHPYTSLIPITIYVVGRNIFPLWRRYHMHLFEYLGKITLETYIGQFHVWMATVGINGAPKRLLRVLPKGWPLLNFVVMSGVFFIVSMRLFHNTNTLKAFALPPKSPTLLLRRNLAIAGAMLGVTYVWAFMLKGLVERYY